MGTSFLTHFLECLPRLEMSLGQHWGPAIPIMTPEVVIREIS